MFAIVDEIKEQRDWLRVNHPELAQRISDAAKKANDRLTPEETTA